MTLLGINIWMQQTMPDAAAEYLGNESYKRHDNADVAWSIFCHARESLDRVTRQIFLMTKWRDLSSYVIISVSVDIDVIFTAIGIVNSGPFY